MSARLTNFRQKISRPAGVLILLSTLVLLSVALTACGTIEVGIEVTPTPEPTQVPVPLTYENDVAGFMFEYPTGWELAELPAQVSLTRGSLRLAIHYQTSGAAFDPAVLGSGMPAGDLIYRDKIAFLDQVIPANVLAYENKDKAVYYGSGPIEISNLVFVIRLEDTASLPYEAQEIPPDAQAEAIRILESIQLTGQQANIDQDNGSPGYPPPPEGETQPGSLQGRICFPSEFIPEMTIFIQNLDSAELTSMTTDENQPNYEIALGAGQYLVYAYLNADPTTGGAYSRAVPCGLSVECTDHTMLPVTIQAGQVTTGADLCDWYDSSNIPANPNASEPADPAAAGLVYIHPTKGIWQVQTDGLAHWLFPYPEVDAISSDGSLALLTRGDDIWLANRTTGSLRNLTNTPDRHEFEAMFWPANPQVIVFGSIGGDEEKGFSNGYLTRMQLDGSGYQVLEPDGKSIGAASLSPDGQTIAYETADQAWIYRDDTGKVLFDPAVYGVSGVERVISPAWSPDGSRLAWWIGGRLNGALDYTLSLAVFDLAGGGVTLLHPYTPIGGDGWPANPAWDSSGQWLATQTISEAGTKGNLWVLEASGGEEINLANGAYPVWDPQGNGLIYIEWGGGSFEDSIDRLTHVGDWALQDLQMQPGSLPFAWLED